MDRFTGICQRRPPASRFDVKLKRNTAKTFVTPMKKRKASKDPNFACFHRSHCGPRYRTVTCNALPSLFADRFGLGNDPKQQKGWRIGGGLPLREMRSYPPQDPPSALHATIRNQLSCKRPCFQLWNCCRNMLHFLSSGIRMRREPVAETVSQLHSKKDSGNPIRHMHGAGN